MQIYTDTAGFISNAFHFVAPERSYLYGRIIRCVAVPFRSLELLLALHMLAGAAVAGLLGLVLIRWFRVSYPVALAGMLVFAWDPVQVEHEHLVMTETLAGLTAAVFLAVSLQYLDDRKLRWLALIGLLGIPLVGFRVIYVPMVWLAAVILPILGNWGRPFRQHAVALLVVLAATAVGQAGYQGLTGLVSRREPAYHYRTGFFMVGNVGGIIRPEDASGPAGANAIREQQRSTLPLHDTSPLNRNMQLWAADGLVDRLRSTFSGDAEAANREARHIAQTAIRRDPGGFLRLGIDGLAFYRKLLGRNYANQLRMEDGYHPGVQPTPTDWTAITGHFPRVTQQSNMVLTPSRRYHLHTRFWPLFQLFASVLGWIAALWARGDVRRGAVWFAIWSTALLAITCLTTPICFRYLHPFTFTGLAAAALLVTRPTERG